MAFCMLALSWLIAGPVLIGRFNIEPHGIGLSVCERFHILPLMLLGGGDDSKLDKILPFILMQGAAGNAAGGLNSILPLLLLKGEGGLGGDIDPMMLMALSGGLGGAAGAAGGMNPLMMMALLGKGDLFGGSTTPVAPALQRANVAPRLYSKF